MSTNYSTKTCGPRNARTKDRHNINISTSQISKGCIYQQHYEQNATESKKTFYPSRIQHNAFVVDKAHLPIHTTSQKVTLTKE